MQHELALPAALEADLKAALPAARNTAPHSPFVEPEMRIYHVQLS
jgi:hypothetical protein